MSQVDAAREQRSPRKAATADVRRCSQSPGDERHDRMEPQHFPDRGVQVVVAAIELFAEPLEHVGVLEELEHRVGKSSRRRLVARHEQGPQFVHERGAVDWRLLAAARGDEDGEYVLSLRRSRSPSFDLFFEGRVQGSDRVVELGPGRQSAGPFRQCAHSSLDVPSEHQKPRRAIAQAQHPSDPVAEERRIRARAEKGGKQELEHELLHLPMDVDRFTDRPSGDPSLGAFVHGALVCTEAFRLKRRAHPGAFGPVPLAVQPEERPLSERVEPSRGLQHEVRVADVKHVWVARQKVAERARVREDHHGREPRQAQRVGVAEGAPARLREPRWIDQERRRLDERRERRTGRQRRRAREWLRRRGDQASSFYYSLGRMVAPNGCDDRGSARPSKATSRASKPFLARALADFLGTQARLRRRPVRYLFVLGHMRSGSSLLAHVLASHPEIRGLGESWLRHENRATLRDLAVWVHAGLRKPFLTEAYVLDKILHDELVGDDGVLGLPEITSIFLVRGAERSLKSLFSNRGKLLGISDWESAARYYERRLERLAAEARRIDDPGKMLFLTYESLVERPAAALDATTRFLGLRSPLVERYRVTSRTGTAGLGDFGDHIRSGTIVKTPAPAVDVPEDVLERGRAAHAACVRELSGRCTTAPPDAHATVA